MKIFYDLWFSLPGWWHTWWFKRTGWVLVKRLDTDTEACLGYFWKH